MERGSRETSNSLRWHGACAMSESSFQAHYHRQQYCLRRLCESDRCRDGNEIATKKALGFAALLAKNFEAGILTDDPEMLDAAIEQFDNVWIGKFFASSSINAARNVAVESIVQIQ